MLRSPWESVGVVHTKGEEKAKTLRMCCFLKLHSCMLIIPACQMKMFLPEHFHVTLLIQTWLLHVYLIYRAAVHHILLNSCSTYCWTHMFSAGHWTYEFPSYRNTTTLFTQDHKENIVHCMAKLCTVSFQSAFHSKWNILTDGYAKRKGLAR